jgi:hypothetical protein
MPILLFSVPKSAIGECLPVCWFRDQLFNWTVA